jgi:hypothetical protein
MPNPFLISILTLITTLATTLKINIHKGLPCGNEGFIRKLSDKVGRDLSFKKESDLEKGGVLIIHFTEVSILLEMGRYPFIVKT